jgi:5-(carboxyamino)imidazole ribonucleotide mutase
MGKGSRRANSTPLVGILMGSDSDLEAMRPAIDVLGEFGISFEVRVLSAHRTPFETLEYGHQAAKRGLRVIIAGAGWAAALPGVLAAATPLPVIGVPIPSSQLSGLDALLSIAQMPSGVPVATVAIGGARNAGLLALRILGVSDEALREAMERFQADLADSARARDAAIREQF